MLLGSAFYIHFVEKGIERIPAWYVLLPVVAVVLTGAWQFVLALQGGVTSNWHMVFGMKVLLALHVIVISLLQIRQNIDPEKRRRWITGIVYSGSVVVILGGVLRYFRTMGTP